MPRDLAGFLAALAILLQVLTAAPLLLRMAEFGRVPICLADGGDRHEVPADGLPAHDHAHCLLCQASALPPVPSAALPPRPGLVATRIAAQPRHVGPRDLRRAFATYASRAPPAIV